MIKVNRLISLISQMITKVDFLYIFPLCIAFEEVIVVAV
jgi:hypothetical protein